MLAVTPGKSQKITVVERKEDCLFLYADACRYRLEPKGENILRVTVTGEKHFLTEQECAKPGVILQERFGDWRLQETEEEIRLQMAGLEARIDRNTGSFSYYDGKGVLLLRERARNAKSLERFKSYRLAEQGKLEKEIIETADGRKEVVRSADRVEAGSYYHTRICFAWQEGERLYGLGQQEEGFGNLRGQTVYLHQANRKIAIPMLVSDRGYGILMDTYSPMIFSDTVYGSYLYTEADAELDFYVINGGSPDGVIKGYRQLTGKAVMLPKWAFGYLQSQERYETQEEILQMAEEYRRRNLGLDALILDWLSWEDGKWGQKSFDRTRFPDVPAMTKRLHDENVHFMISIWPNMDPSCEDNREFAEAKLFLPGSNTYDPFQKAGRELYWSQVERNLFSKGIDGWWCDSSEPYTYEWNCNRRQEPAKLFAEYCRETADRIPAPLTNSFCLYHAMGIYEGQRGVYRVRQNERDERDCGIVGMAENAGSRNTEDAGMAVNQEKRVCNLTRSAYTGQQRYGTIMWSGDIGASWETLKKQIAAGLSFCASGLPYWTVDIGAFFVKTGEQWYWDGEYPEGTDDPGYRELFVRWYQWGCFLPVFRGHGTDCRRELWSFGQEGEPFYDALVKYNRLRYRLMPYIYALAGKVWREDDSMIKMLAFAFPEDETAVECRDQYLFGDSLMVCPVTEPMYYLSGSREIKDADRTRAVWLPAGCGWYDFWTETRYEGGQWIKAEAGLDVLPLFVREGSILPMTEFTGSTAGCGAIELRIYAGRDAEFSLYEDAGDGYAYEQGDYSVRKLCWNEKAQELTALQEHGSADAAYVAKIAWQRVIGKNLDV